ATVHVFSGALCSGHLGMMIIFFFFFSSRRRHTRFSRNWSSDVCSSDLIQRPNDLKRQGAAVSGAPYGSAGILPISWSYIAMLGRSEERRVGKECRSRWSPYRSKKKEVDGRDIVVCREYSRGIRQSCEKS